MHPKVAGLKLTFDILEDHFVAWLNSSVEEEERHLEAFAEEVRTFVHREFSPAVWTELKKVRKAAEIAGPDRSDARRRWPEFCALIDAEFQEIRRAAGQELEPIPEEKKTRRMSKNDALALMVWPSHITNERQALDWLNSFIELGAIQCEKYNRKSFYFNVDDFPEEHLDKVRQYSNC